MTTQPFQPPTPEPPPTQWGVGHGTLPNGAKVCIVQLIQGPLMCQLQIAPGDLKRMAADFIQGAQQAETGLIVPSTVTLNGHHPK